MREIAGDLALTSGDRVIGPSVIPGLLDQDRDPFEPGEDLLGDGGQDHRRGGRRGAGPYWRSSNWAPTTCTGPATSSRPVNGHAPRWPSLAAERTNLLLLDEPTNHLDLAAIEQLEHALAGYQGTFVIATHDRRLLETIGITRTIGFGADGR